MKVQQENIKVFNKNRKEAVRYRISDLVAIKRTQSGPGLKLAHKYLGPYKITKILRNDRYMVEKVGDQEGPYQTSTSPDHMKLWIENIDGKLSSESDEE